MIFDPVFSAWMIVLVSIPLTLFFLWLEWRKQNRFRWIRFLSVIVMMVALVGVLLKPKYRAVKSSSIILLTPGYDMEKVDSILQKNPKMVLMHLDQTQPYKNSKLLQHYVLDDRDAEIQVVIGQGIPTYYLDTMDDKVFAYIPAAIPKGLTQLFISPINFMNRKNKIGCAFNNVIGKVQIFLLGPGGKEDSIQFHTKGLHHFNVSFVPKQTGEFIYRLQIKDSLKSYEESLPIYVQRERNLNILFLQHYPTFEIQYLKHFLARKNHRLVLRYQLSKNRFRYEYINRDPIKINEVTPGLLENIDLMIVDSESLSSLSAAEKNTLEKSIHSGLGLLNLSLTKKSFPFIPFETTPAKTDTANIEIGSNTYNFPVTSFRVSADPSIIPFQKSKSGIVSGYTFRGAGKIGFQLLQETYRLSLSGDSIAFSELWTPLLENIARQQSTPSKIKITNPFPWYVNEPIDIEVITSSENVSVMSDSIALPLIEDLSVENVWHARTWAGKHGWHSLTTNDGETLHYYVSDTTEWKSLSLMNQRHANTIAGKTLSHSVKKIEMWEEIPPFIFYLTFLLAAGFIWLVPKL
jgi:hypothetical protein